MGNVSHLVTRTAALQSSTENGLGEGMPAKDRQFVTALARGLDILRAFHAGEGMLGNQEIAHRTGLPKPTVARLTHTLTELGYLNYIRRFRKYELGASVLALGYAAISSMDVRRASRAPLEALAHSLNASTALGGRDRHSMIYLEACRGPSVVAITHDVGTRVPMASTAMGRAYLFSLPDVDRNKHIDAIRRRWRDDWSKVKTGMERSFKELADHGFCVTWGEWLPELCGVGAPLRNTDGTAAYAINASAPIYQISKDRLEADWGPRLVKVARDIRTGMAAQPAQAAAQVQPVRGNGHANGSNGHHGTNGNGNGRHIGQSEAWSCSDKQKALILKIVEDNRLDKQDIEALAQERFSKGGRQSNRREASGRSEERLETHGGNQGNVGWKLVGFPGVSSSNYRELLGNKDVYRAEPVSILDIKNGKVPVDGQGFPKHIPIKPV